MKRLNMALMGLWFCGGMLIGYQFERQENERQLKDIQEVALEACQVQLNDTHHCVSICQKEWEKMEKEGKHEIGQNHK